MNKIVIYTASFGKGHGVIPQKEINGVDFVCFTDDVSKARGVWKPVLFEYNEINDDHLKNRHLKLFPHLYFEKYEFSIYIDPNYLVFGDVVKLLTELKGFKMAIYDHMQSEDARDCIYDEYEAIIELGKQKGNYKDDPEIMKAQMDFFRKQNYPEHNGLIFAAVLIRRHNDKEVIILMEDWWSFVSTRSRRDQLSFDYVAWKNKFYPKILNGDLRKNNPYFYYIGNVRRNYIKKILIYKLKLFFGIIKHPKN